jgi:hypothetical protein
MKAALPNPILNGASLKATVSTGFTVTGPEGQYARLAVVDEKGNILAAGDDVAWAAWRVCVEVQENFWEGLGHLVVHSTPPSQAHNKKQAA